eukprot:CAMPEP_0168317080 /NCGR_PEP_ID=MMETSP0210-20121227/22259_1 /TAXON_ID=40633 /ORGANISM="Condylostoma magnum, Strain COL2" /LENGTH=65 /DNA_ID=CAMNT_0008310631 /DNA_START=492 /DNA_END=689 /DNA_ORIENTATION=-
MYNSTKELYRQRLGDLRRKGINFESRDPQLIQAVEEIEQKAEEIRTKVFNDFKIDTTSVPPGVLI